MMKFVLTTSSQSGDDYSYFIKHESVPTPKDIARFLREHAYDKDDETVYEQMTSLTEIVESEFLEIPE